MVEIFKMGGPLAFPILLIGVAVVALTVLATIRILNGRMPEGRAGEVRLQALPFWGVVALLLGFLGQASGHFKQLSVMIGAETLNPQRVLMGLRECFSTTMMGLSVCVVALLAWAALRALHRLKSAQAG